MILVDDVAPRDRDRGHAAHRLRRLPDPARRPGAHPEHPRQRDRAGDHRRRRQLPRLRRRGAPTSTRRSTSWSTPRRSARACATRPSRWSCTRRSPTRSCPRVADALARAGRRARRRRRRPAPASPAMGAATDDDFGREFLDLKMSVAVVPSLDAAIDARQPVRHRPHRGDPHPRPRRGRAASPTRSTPPPSS